MSVRNMLKFMMSLLLAMTLVATFAHAARLDKLDASIAKEAVQVKGKSEAIAKSEVYPYDECEEKCHGICICAGIWPPPAICICATPIMHSIANKEEAVQVKGKSEAISKSEVYPYDECEEKCHGICICAGIWPPPAICICATPIMHSIANKGNQLIEEAVQVKGKSEATSKSEVYPYDECEEKCHGICICAGIWPPPAICICATPIMHSIANKEEAVQVKGKSEAIAKSEVYPYDECEDKCQVPCICLPIWPPPATCICPVPIMDSIANNGEGKELHNKLDLLGRQVQKGSSGHDKNMAVGTKAKMEAMDCGGCAQPCEECVYILIRGEPKCLCLAPKPPAVDGTALAM